MNLWKKRRLIFHFAGGEVGFWQGKVDKLIDDFRDFKPTILTMVPRLLNKLYDKVRSESRKKGLIGRILFRLAVRTKLEFIRRGDFSQNTIWDKLIFHKVRQSFGGKVTRVVSTSAPLSAEVCAFSRAAFPVCLSNVTVKQNASSVAHKHRITSNLVKQAFLQQ